MLGREPRLPHVMMRWLIISVMALNGLQLILLQIAINSSAQGRMDLTWFYLGLSGMVLLVVLGLIAYAFAAGRISDR